MKMAMENTEKKQSGDEMTWHYNIYQEDNIQVSIVDGLKGIDEKLGHIMHPTRDTMFCVAQDEERKELKLMLLSDGPEKESFVLFQGISFDSKQLTHDCVAVLNRRFTDKETDTKDKDKNDTDNEDEDKQVLDLLVHEDQSYGALVISCNEETGRTLEISTQWNGYGIDPSITIDEYGPNEVLSQVVTWGTGIIGTAEGELICVGGCDPVGGLICSQEIPGVSKEQLYYVVKYTNGKFNILQEGKLPPQCNACSAALCYNGCDGMHMWCVFVDAGGYGGILTFDKINDKYQCALVGDLYHSNHFATCSGKKIHSIHRGATPSRLIVAFAGEYDYNNKISDVIHIDFDNRQFIHSIGVPKHHKNKVVSLDVVRINPYSLEFFWGCCDLIFCPYEIVCWEQKSIVIAAVRKPQPDDCFLSDVPEDVLTYIFKYLGTVNKPYPVLGQPLPPIFKDAITDTTVEDEANHGEDDDANKSALKAPAAKHAPTQPTP